MPCTVALKGKMGRSHRQKHHNIELNWAMLSWKMCPWVNSCISMAYRGDTHEWHFPFYGSADIWPLKVKSGCLGCWMSMIGIYPKYQSVKRFKWLLRWLGYQSLNDFSGLRVRNVIPPNDLYWSLLILGSLYVGHRCSTLRPPDNGDRLLPHILIEVWIGLVFGIKFYNMLRIVVSA